MCPHWKYVDSRVTRLGGRVLQYSAGEMRFLIPVNMWPGPSNRESLGVAHGYSQPQGSRLKPQASLYILTSSCSQLGLCFCSPIYNLCRMPLSLLLSSHVYRTCLEAISRNQVLAKLIYISHF